MLLLVVTVNVPRWIDRHRLETWPMRENSWGPQTQQWLSLWLFASLCWLFNTFFLHKRLSSSALASICTENIPGTGLNYSRPNGITGDKREHAFQAILSTLSRNEMGFCMRNIVVSKHKASLCSTASSSENSRQTEDQLQRWKWGQGGFFSLLLFPKSGFSSGSSPLLSPPFLIPNWEQTQLCKMRETWCQSFVFCKCLAKLSQVVWSKNLLKVSLWQHLWWWKDNLQRLHHFNHTVLLFQWSWNTVV